MGGEVESRPKDRVKIRSPGANYLAGAEMRFSGADHAADDDPEIGKPDGDTTGDEN